MKVRELTLEERKEIEKWARRSVSASEIARIIGRSKNCVITEFQRISRDVYKAVDAHLLALEKKAKKREKLIEHNKGKGKLFSVHEKIQSLEMQIEILVDEVKRLSKTIEGL